MPRTKLPAPADEEMTDAPVGGSELTSTIDHAKVVQAHRAELAARINNLDVTKAMLEIYMEEELRQSSKVKALQQTLAVVQEQNTSFVLLNLTDETAEEACQQLSNLHSTQLAKMTTTLDESYQVQMVREKEMDGAQAKTATEIRFLENDPEDTQMQIAYAAQQSRQREVETAAVIEALEA